MATELTPCQIEKLSRVLMQDIVINVVTKTKAKLFGGAVRDMILVETSKKDVLPSSLDFFVTDKKEFRVAAEFVEHTYNVTSFELESGKKTMQIPLFTTAIVKRYDPYVLVNVILKTADSRTYFDVDSLVLGENGLEPHENIDHIYRHISIQTAHLLSLIFPAASRCKDMVNRGWTITTPFGTLGKIARNTKCSDCNGFASFHAVIPSVQYFCESCLDLFLLRRVELERKERQSIMEKFAVFSLIQSSH